MADNYYSGDGSSKEEPIFGIRTIGASKWVDGSNPDPVQAVQAEIRSGAGHIEITAPGTGRGDRNSPTFEGFDQDQRQAIRELAKINDVNIYTHATPSVTLNGSLGQQQGFSEEARKKGVDEVKKAIDFAADAANGGSVVMHTGEYQRPYYNVKGGEGLFQRYDNEEKDSEYLVVDSQTGRFINSVRGDAFIYEPDIQKDENGNDKFLTDGDGNPVYDDVLKEDILETYKEENPNVKWEDIPEEYKDRAKVKLFNYDDDGNIQTKRVTFDEFKHNLEKEGASLSQIAKEFYKKQAYSQIQASLGSAREFETSYTTGLKQRSKLIDTYKEMKQMLDEAGDDEVKREEIQNHFLKEIGVDYEKAKEDLENEKKVNPNFDADDKLGVAESFFKNAISDNQRRILYGRESATSARTQAREQLKKINQSKGIDEYAMEKTRKSAAELGIYAMQKTEEARAKRPNDRIDPINLTLENIYPEWGYGSAPSELLDIVQQGREEMAKQLMKNNMYSEKEAKKKAEEHLKITLDTGHMHMWRKHFIAKEGESKEETDARYNKWYLKEIEKLADAKVIGNVHLADNFGYDDAHLAPGQGTAPIKEFMKIMKKHGYDKKMIVEGGFNQGKNGMHEAWKMAGTSIYNTGRAGTDAWVNPGSRFYNVQDGYLSQANKPHFIFKGYAPDSEDWQPWSGTTME